MQGRKGHAGFLSVSTLHRKPDSPLLLTICQPSSSLPQHSPQTNSSVSLHVSHFCISFTDPPDYLSFITKRGQTPMHSVFSRIICKSQKQIFTLNMCIQPGNYISMKAQCSLRKIFRNKFIKHYN